MWLCYTVEKERDGGVGRTSTKKMFAQQWMRILWEAVHVGNPLKVCNGRRDLWIDGECRGLKVYSKWEEEAHQEPTKNG